ncbi:MAG: hypothetical protein ABW139_15165 [Candidatus Thiodiazotropha sp. DIVDIV]
MPHIKAFLSTFFAALANGQATIRNYYVARWLVGLAMRLAFEPYSYSMAHAVAARTENIKKNKEQVLASIKLSLEYIDGTKEIQGFREIVKMREKLIKLRESYQ